MKTKKYENGGKVTGAKTEKSTQRRLIRRK